MHMSVHFLFREYIAERNQTAGSIRQKAAVDGRDSPSSVLQVSRPFFKCHTRMKVSHPYEKCRARLNIVTSVLKVSHPS